MAVYLPPSFVQARSDHTAQQDRLNLQGIVSPGGGVGYLSTPLVRAQAAPALSVIVARERFYIPGTSSVHQGIYHAYNDGDLTVSLGASAGHGTLTRIDMLVAEIRDAAYSGIYNDWQFRIVAGTAGSGVKPTLPVNAIEIATITMPAGASTITNAYIVNTARVASMRGAPYPILSSQLGTIVNPYDSMQVWFTDLDQLWGYTGAAWTFIGGKTTRNWEQLRSTNPSATDTYGSGSFTGLLAVTLGAGAPAGRYDVTVMLSISGSVVTSGNLRVLAGATALAFDCRFDPITTLTMQTWIGSYYHSGGAITIQAQHQGSAGGMTVFNACAKIRVDYLGAE